MKTQRKSKCHVSPIDRMKHNKRKSRMKLIGEICFDAVQAITYTAAVICLCLSIRKKFRKLF